MSLGFQFGIGLLLSQEILWNDPDRIVDLGDGAGRTRYGITEKAHPTVDLDALTMDGAVHIYEQEYWNKLQLDLLSIPVAVFTLEGAANHGATTCFGLLQQVVGVEADGVPGPMTAAAVRARPAPSVIADFVDARVLRYMKSANWSKFHKSWMRRLVASVRYCAGLP